MKFFRYRRTSWKTFLGLTQAKKQLKKALGITALLKPFRWWTNLKRRVKRNIGYESTAGRILRTFYIGALPGQSNCNLMSRTGVRSLQDPFHTLLRSALEYLVQAAVV